MRGQTLSIREKEYVEAARSLGAGDCGSCSSTSCPTCRAGHRLTTLLVPTAIVFEATLSFLGLGVAPPTPTWGNMITDSLAFYQVAWWYILFPGLALLITTLAFNLLGDASATPSTRSRRAAGGEGAADGPLPRPPAAVRPARALDHQRAVFVLFFVAPRDPARLRRPARHPETVALSPPARPGPAGAEQYIHYVGGSCTATSATVQQLGPYAADLRAGCR